MDPSKINWKVVGTVLAALGYVAYRNKGFKGFGRAIAKHGTVAAVLAIVAYFGLDYVMNRVQAPALPPDAGEPAPPPEQLPPQTQPSVDGYATPPARLRTGIRGPGGLEATRPLGC